MQTIELNVQGMTCGGCVKHVTKALQSVPGVNQVSVDLASGRARVDSDLPLGAKSLIAASPTAHREAETAKAHRG